MQKVLSASTHQGTIHLRRFIHAYLIRIQTIS